MLRSLSPGQRAEIQKLAIEDKQRVIWRPLVDLDNLTEPTPQQRAYDSLADELLYGGAAGGGKTDLLLGTALTRSMRAIIFRRESTQLRGIEDRMAEILGTRDGYSSQNLIWRLPEGRQLEFGHCQHLGDEQKYQGRPHDLKGFDELTHFTEHQYRYLNTWKRTTKPGQRTRTISATNPPTSGEGEWVREYWGPWLDEQHENPAAPGELRWYAVVDGEDVEREDGSLFEWRGEIIEPQSRTFIPSSVDDNPYLNAAYKATLQGLPEPLRSQMLKGDWNAATEDHPWQVIPTTWVLMAQDRWRRGKRPKMPMSAVGADVSQGGADETVLTPRYGDWIDEQKVRPGREMQSGDDVAGFVAAVVRDGAQVNIDCTGGWGGDAWKRLHEMGVPVLRLIMSEGSEQRDLTGSLGFYNKRAEIYWRGREWLDPANGHEPAIPPDPRIKADLCSARWKVARGTAGDGGRIQIEPKDKQIELLGRSPDRGESLLYSLESDIPQQALHQHRRGGMVQSQADMPGSPFDYL